MIPDTAGVKSRQAPLIAHVIYRLDVGGLENGLVNIINGLPEGKFRHAIICLTDYTEFHKKIRPRVELVALNKQPGHDVGLYWRLFKAFRALRPDIVHTRNLSALEAQVPAWLAGVKRRVHGLHGWDMSDLKGENTGYIRLYQVINPLIQRYIPLSNDLERYLLDKINVPESKVTKICNGVDTLRFSPADKAGKAVLPDGFASEGAVVIGTVGRLEAVKDQLMLVEAFIDLLRRVKDGPERLRLVLVGNGSMREKLVQRVAEAGIQSQVWLAGARSDVPELLRAFDIFALPSKAEGISNTLLEAMATGLPVVATDVGGNAQLVGEGETGYITPPENAGQFADKLNRYLNSPQLLEQHAKAARERVEQLFSLQAMIRQYESVYDQLLLHKRY